MAANCLAFEAMYSIINPPVRTCRLTNQLKPTCHPCTVLQALKAANAYVQDAVSNGATVRTGGYGVWGMGCCLGLCVCVVPMQAVNVTRVCGTRHDDEADK